MSNKGKDFFHLKSLGQNFLTDTNLLRAIVVDAGVVDSDIVIEVGAGAGSLTAELAAAAKRVMSFEIDERLKEILNNKFAGGNVTLVFKDILKEDFDRINEFCGGQPYKLIANLPYYITTPVLFYFIESANPPDTISVMVQKEVAERLTAKSGTKDYGALTAQVTDLYDVKISRNVSRKMFTPEPNVDSAVVLFSRHNRGAKDRVLYRKLVKSAFSMRRKTLINNLMHSFGLPRETFEKMLISLNLPITVRGEVLSAEEFRALSEIFKVKH